MHRCSALPVLLAAFWLPSCSAAVPQLEPLPVPRSQVLPATPPVRPPPPPCSNADPLVFRAPAPERGSGLVFAPSGEVLAFSSSWLDVLDPRSGKHLDGKRLCYGLRAFAFVADDRAVAICPEEILEVTYPGLAYRQVLHTNVRHNGARIGKRVVVLTYERSAEVYDATSWQRLDQYTARERISSLALSPDDTLLALGESEHQVEVRRLLDKRTTSFKTQQAFVVKLLAFSADGSELFVAEGSFQRRPQAYRWETGQPSASIPSLQTLGRPFGGIDPRSFDEEFPVALSPDGSVHCAIAQKEVVCKTHCDGSTAGSRP